MARTDHEKRVIERFLELRNAERSDSHSVAAWPDVDSTRPEIDALAVDGAGCVLALEHTLIQPFEGEQNDAATFLSGVGALDQDPDLLVDGLVVTLSFKVRAVPKGVNWTKVRLAVKSWYAAAIHSLPKGASLQTVPVGFPLEVHVDKQDMAGKARLFLARQWPGGSIEPVVRTALHRKLPKLTAAVADIRILLAELNTWARSHTEVGEAITTLAHEFPSLSAVDEVWVIKTGAWHVEDFTPIYHVWPRRREAARRRLIASVRRRGA